MTHPTLELINRYESLKSELARAISAAGGSPSVVMSDPAWVTVLAEFVANDIVIEARYVGGKDDNR